jgi:hypothetical protein
MMGRLAGFWFRCLVFFLSYWFSFTVGLLFLGSLVCGGFWFEVFSPFFDAIVFYTPEGFFSRVGGGGAVVGGFFDAIASAARTFMYL